MIDDFKSMESSNSDAIATTSETVKCIALLPSKIPSSCFAEGFLRITWNSEHQGFVDSNGVVWAASSDLISSFIDTHTEVLLSSHHLTVTALGEDKLLVRSTLVGEVIYDLSIPEVGAFFYELEFISQVVALHHASQSNKNLDIVSLSGYELLSSQFDNESSPESRTALLLIDSIFGEFVASKSNVKEVVMIIFGGNSHGFYPPNIQEKIQFQRRLFMAGTDENVSDSNTTYTTNELGDFHIVLWFSIGFCFVLYYTLSAVMSMPIGKDSMFLYAKIRMD